MNRNTRAITGSSAVHYPEENELLLNHNAEYKVRKVEGDPNSSKGVTIYLDQLSTGNASLSLPALK
jgi:hypothetical protein